MRVPQSPHIERPQSALVPSPEPLRPRFLSEADCQDLIQRLARYAKGGGETTVAVASRWTGNVRWARNRVTTSGENRQNHIKVTRLIQGAGHAVEVNELSDAALVAAARRAERLATFALEQVDADVMSRPASPLRPRDEAVAVPQLFFDATYQLDAAQRAVLARQLMTTAAAAGMLSAGYLEVSATSLAYLTSWGWSKYEQYTWAQYSVTVRDPTGVGSGWAGVDWPEWRKIDGATLSALALDKCLKSRHPVAVEPGRYTTILEPQAAHDFVGGLIHHTEGFQDDLIGRALFEGNAGWVNQVPGHEPPFLAGDQQHAGLGRARFGDKVIDERLSLRQDPMDPELGVPPYLNWLSSYKGVDTDVYHPALWIEQGVLKALYYDRDYAINHLGRQLGSPNTGAFRMSVTGPTTSIEEMIVATKRGILVTRFDQLLGPYTNAATMRGYTRDGLWLIENGKISHPVKNMQFVESITGALNNVEQVGVPQRVFHPFAAAGGSQFWQFGNPQPAIVPALKIRDFSFTALSDAV